MKQVYRELPFVIPKAGVKQSAKVHGPLVFVEIPLKYMYMLLASPMVHAVVCA